MPSSFVSLDGADHIQGRAHHCVHGHRGFRSTRVVERTHSWMNDYGKLRRCTERSGEVVDFYLYLAAALVTLRMLIRRATSHYRWDGRPTTRRLK